MICALSASLILGGVPWRTLYSRRFSIDGSQKSFLAAVHSKAYPACERVVIDLIELCKGTKWWVTSTVVDEPVSVWRVRAHAVGGFAVRYRTNIGPTTSWLLTGFANGGQFDSLLVWRFDPKTMRPMLILRVLQGDDSKLGQGIRH